MKSAASLPLGIPLMQHRAIQWLSLVSLVVLFSAVTTAGEQRRPTEWKTNFENRSIDLSELSSGGPPKDGIPALFKPRFISTEDAGSWLSQS